MKSMLILAVSGTLAAQVACAAPTPLEIHQRVVKHLKKVRDVLVPAPAIRFVESFPPIAIPRAHILHLAQANEEQFQAAVPPPAVDASGLPVDPTGISNWAESFAVSTTQNVLDQFFPRGAGGARRPVIVGADPKSLTPLSEDLTVMLRILEKAAGAKADGPPTAAGIALFSVSQPGSARAFYLDGYGAMFVLNVKYPLLAPPKPEAADRTNDATNSEWERAKEEVYGRKFEAGEMRFKAAPGEEFDAQRVETLKTQLIDGLANARNIRHLKPDDNVTAVVLGSAPGVVAAQSIPTRRSRGGQRPNDGDNQGVALTGARADAAQSTLTLRVKKSDVDALAQGKLNEDDFHKKVSVQIY